MLTLPFTVPLSCWAHRGLIPPSLQAPGSSRLRASHRAGGSKPRARPEPGAGRPGQREPTAHLQPPPFTSQTDGREVRTAGPGALPQPHPASAGSTAWPVVTVRPAGCVASGPVAVPWSAHPLQSQGRSFHGPWGFPRGAMVSRSPPASIARMCTADQDSWGPAPVDGATWPSKGRSPFPGTSVCPTSQPRLANPVFPLEPLWGVCKVPTWDLTGTFLMTKEDKHFSCLLGTWFPVPVCEASSKSFSWFALLLGFAFLWVCCSFYISDASCSSDLCNENGFSLSVALPLHSLNTVFFEKQKLSILI